MSQDVVMAGIGAVVVVVVLAIAFGRRLTLKWKEWFIETGAAAASRPTQRMNATNRSKVERATQQLSASADQVINASGNSRITGAKQSAVEQPKTGERRRR